MSFINLPTEIQQTVLSHVDNFRQLSQFSLVCKSFHAITTQECFLKSILSNLDINASNLVSREKIEKINETKQNRLTLLWVKMILSQQEHNHFYSQLTKNELRKQDECFVKLANLCLPYDGILYSLHTLLSFTPMKAKQALSSLKVSYSILISKTRKERKIALLGQQALNDYFNLQRFYPDMVGLCVKNLFRDKNIQNIVSCIRSEYYSFSNTVFSALCSHLAESSHSLGVICLTINNSQLPKLLLTLKGKTVNELNLVIPDLTIEGIDFFVSISEINAKVIRIKLNSIFYKNENKNKELAKKAIQMTQMLKAVNPNSCCIGSDDIGYLNENWEYDGIYWASSERLLLPIAIKTIYESNDNESSKEYKTIKEFLKSCKDKKC